MFAVWLAGFAACLGMWWVWRSEWHMEGESQLTYCLRVITVCSTSWLGVGLAIGRIAWALRDKDQFPDKG